MNSDRKGEEVTEEIAGLSEELMNTPGLSEIKARGPWCRRVGPGGRAGDRGPCVLRETGEQAVSGKAKRASALSSKIDRAWNSGKVRTRARLKI